MSALVWKLLRQHISIGQLAGFFLANLFGMMIVLLSVQFYKDVIPVFTEGDSFMKKDFIIATKKISTLGSFAGKSNTFTAEDITDLKKQPFTKTIGAFTPSQFKVSAGLGMQEAGIHLSTDMFFESVPDEFVDIKLDKWHFDESTHTIPIIIPRNYLNLYNFGFAQSRNLPKLSEGLMSLIQMDIMMRGNGRVEQYKGNIVGFSNRLNTILVPQSFMKWANENFAPGAEAQPSRLIIEVNNPADSSIAGYFQKKGYETEDGKLDAGKTTYFLRLIVGIVLGVGLFISILSFYILMLSIFLLLQKNTTKLESLLLMELILQSQQSGIALSITHGRFKYCRTCPIHRTSLLVTWLLPQQYPITFPAIGNRFIMGSRQYGNSVIPRCICNQYTHSQKEDFFHLDT